MNLLGRKFIPLWEIGSDKMKLNINGKTVSVEDKIADTFAQISRTLNNSAVEFLLKLEGVDTDTLSDKELEKKVNAVLVNELKELEYLSRPEIMKATVDFANRKLTED